MKSTVDVMHVELSTTCWLRLSRQKHLQNRKDGRCWSCRLRIVVLTGGRFSPLKSSGPSKAKYDPIVERGEETW